MIDAQTTGEVFDLGYQRYTGAREGRGRARMAVFWDGVRISIGLGRTGSQKFLPWLFIAFAIGPAVLIVIVASISSQFGDAGNGPDGFGNREYYQFAFIPLLAFALTVGPALLCPDRRQRVLSLYLVRPLTTMDYVSARMLSFLAVSTAVAYVPQIIIFATLTLTASAPLDYLRANWLLVPRFAASGLVITGLATALAMAASSLTDRRGVATAAGLGFVLVLAAASGLVQEVAGSSQRYVELLQIPPVVQYTSDWIFGNRIQAEAAHENPLPGIAYLGTLIGYLAVFCAVVWRKYWRLRA